MYVGNKGHVSKRNKQWEQDIMNVIRIMDVKHFLLAFVLQLQTNLKLHVILTNGLRYTNA